MSGGGLAGSGQPGASTAGEPLSELSWEQCRALVCSQRRATSALSVSAHPQLARTRWRFIHCVLRPAQSACAALQLECSHAVSLFSWPNKLVRVPRLVSCQESSETVS